MSEMVLLNLLRDLIHSNCKKSRNKSIPTKSYKDGKYRISNHAITRMNDRKITKGELHVNLHTTPIKLSPIKYGDNGPSYERFSKNKINSRINPKTNKVSTVSRFHTTTYNKIMKERGDK